MKALLASGLIAAVALVWWLSGSKPAAPVPVQAQPASSDEPAVESPEPVVRVALAEDAAPSDALPGEEILKAVYGADSARVRAAVEEAARSRSDPVEWQYLEPWEDAYQQVLDSYDASWMRERSGSSEVGWPGVDLLRPVEPATGEVLEKVAEKLKALTRSMAEIPTDVAAMVDRELIATNTQVQAAARHYGNTLLDELRSRVASGDYRKAPLNSSAMDAINGPREPRPEDQRLMAHTNGQGQWYVEVWLYRSTSPLLASAADELDRQKKERDDWAAKRALELLE